MIRVLLIDDNDALRQVLASVLSPSGGIELLAQVDSADPSRPLNPTESADFAVIHLLCGDRDPLQSANEIRRRFPEAAVVVLSSEEPSTEHDGRSRGVAGTTEDAPDGRWTIRWLPPIAGAARAGATDHQDAADEVDGSDNHRLADLSPRELQVLAAIVRGLANEEIAAELHLGTETVRTHVSHILHKLGVGSRLQAAVIAVREGIDDRT